MKILFIHQNFPGQFKHVATALADRGHDVAALTMRQDEIRYDPRVRLFRWQLARGSTPDIHPWVADFETKVIRAEAAFRAALDVKVSGYSPDVVVAHPGFGDSLFLKKVWPAAPLGIYCEYFYQAQGADIGFDPEFPVTDAGDSCRVDLKNLSYLLMSDQVVAGISPTQWQADTYPHPFRDRITVVHDGIDTDLVAPQSDVTMTLGSGLTLRKGDEVVTFVNRNLEPYRGFHIFTRALPEILRRRPSAHVLIVGGTRRGYGPRPKTDGTWRDIFTGEVRPLIPDKDWSRVHFLGNVPYNHFLPMLQISAVHVYLTYPFVLSWSLLEALSAGCAVVASDTAPVREAIQQDENGRLVPFFDVAGLAGQVCELLGAPTARERLGRRARALARELYDVRVCLPKQLAWVESLR